MNFNRIGVLFLLSFLIIPSASFSEMIQIIDSSIEIKKEKLPDLNADDLTEIHNIKKFTLVQKRI
jgi:hypothetical protein